MSSDKNEIRNNFMPYKMNKILVYGTGKIAERVIDVLRDFDIVGVSDGRLFYGTFKGLKILPWEEINKGDVDIVIVAATATNQKTIFRRIQDKCLAYDILVLDEFAEKLSVKYGYDLDRKQLASYCEKSKEGLKVLIDAHEAISFDIFDTLVMRRTLEPNDVFDIVAVRMEKKGYSIPNFKAQRFEADFKSDNATLDSIYQILQEKNSLSDEVTDMFKLEELQVEKDVLVARRDMVEVFNYAVNTGKKVSLISNMYLTKTVVEELLAGLGIAGYEKIYISCEYGTGKGGNLFQIYRNDVKELKCLHIGDNPSSDIQMARKNGIDAYEVHSSLDMFRMSSMHKILVYARNLNERNLVGCLISEIFNSPFALEKTYGVLKIQDLSMMGMFFFGPLVVKYLSELAKYLEGHQGYDGVLFAARDGYLYQKIYEEYKYTCGDGLILPKSYYFLTSRKAALRVAGLDDDIIDVLEKYLSMNGAEYVLRDILGIKDLMPKCSGEDDISYLKRHIDCIYEKATKTRRNYSIYMVKEGIHKDGKYLFCEQDSQGTTQNALKGLFTYKMEGFYLIRHHNYKIYNLPIDAVCDTEKNLETWQGMCSATAFMETVMTALTPSIEDIGEGGVPVYDKEARSEKGIAVLKMVHNGIEMFADAYYRISQMDGYISDEIIEMIFQFRDEILYGPECALIEDAAMSDNLLGGEYDLRTGKKK